MRFLVLGPLCLQPLPREEERRVVTTMTVTAPKQRLLLATLLVHANRMVSVDRLIYEIWETPPVTAVNILRQYISKLRSVLARDLSGRVLLRTYSSGYELQCNQIMSDSLQFESLLQAARRQLAAGEANNALGSVEACLEMWRGDAYCDVQSRVSVAAESARLNELRIVAEELSAEARMHSGNPAAAVSELTALIIRNPLRESVHMQLMRVLSATGRKADALQVYRQIRRRLVDELGVEPCHELRLLEYEILVGASG